jgi:glutamine amidotransferase
MSVVIAAFTSDPNLLQCALVRLQREVITSDAKGSQVVGIGSYDQDEVLFQRLRSAVELDSLTKLWPGRESEALLYHSCALPPEMSLEEYAQPFRHRRWMFCHAGSLGELDRAKARLRSLLPEFLERQIHGHSMSEVLFALFLKLLREAGKLDEPIVEASQAGSLLGAMIHLVEQVGAELSASGAATLNCIACNGSLLAATRRGPEPLFYTLLEGSARCERCGIESSTLESLPLVRAHRRQRTVVVASHPARPSSWIEIADGSAVAVGRDLNLMTLPA